MRSSLQPSSVIEPRTLLRFDAIGALVTAGVAAFAAIRPAVFGTPAYNMAILSVFAFGLAFYGTYFSRQRGADWRFHLRRVAKANLLYLGLTAILALRWWPDLTTVGRVYFVGEALLLLSLVRYEFGVVRRPDGDGAAG